MNSSTINDAVTMQPGAAGTLLANRYRITRQLGQGGMGSVWLAEDTQLDNKQFAIKMLPSVLVSNRRAYNQLKDEALVAMRLVHPNIVQIRAFEENYGNPFLVMDYIDGQTLDDYLAEKGKLSEDETIKLLKPIAAALDYAYGEGVVHRDVKPANVMVRQDSRPFILDFGIAREIQETMTRVTGKLSSGTLLYMSPEQLHGAAPKKAQDIYSFAAMAYECLSGNSPFSRGQIEYQIDNDMPEPLADRIGPPGASKSIAASVMSGLAKKPEARPPTCAAVVEGCVPRRDAETNIGMARHVAPIAPQTDGHPVRLGAWKAIFAIVLLAVVASGGAWYHSHWQEEARIVAGATAERKAELTPYEGLRLSLCRADFLEARKYGATVLQIDPDDPEANFGTGMAFLMEEKYKDAEFYLERTLIKRPDEPAVLNNLSIIYRKMNRLDKSLEYVKRAHELAPGNEEIARTLKDTEFAVESRKAALKSEF